MVPGLLWGVLGVIFLGISRGCLVLGFATVDDSSAAIQEAYHSFVMMALVLGMITSGVTACFVESHSKSLLSFGINGSMIVNIAAVIGMSFPGTSITACGVSTFSRRERASTSNLGLLVSLGSNSILLLVATFSTPKSLLSWIQLAAYLTAIIFLLGTGHIAHWVVTFFTTKAHRRKSIINQLQKAPSQLVSLGLLALATAGVSFMLSITSSAFINSLPRGLPSVYDRSYSASSRFDIVVSMYMEDPSSVKLMINQIKSTTLLQLLDFQGHKPRVILYTKDSSANLDSLQRSTGADIVERQENVGREGGTYLKHIIDKWDSLAEQTMFLQAHAHNMREIIPRINDYLIRDTGMLSLGFTGVTCSCGSCDDRWGWEDQSKIIPAIYEKIYGASCDPSQSILLSYKGQFVASAKRIRGVSRDIFVELFKAISSNEGWNLEHNTTVLHGHNIGGVTGKESPSNPFFGFTLERLWSLVMQCATDERVAARCPSLLSGRGIGGLAQDCQCLDT